MAKRRRHNSDDLIFPEDDPIGLTSAFAPIKADPQAVEYDEGDESIGLTQAFATIDTGEGQPAWERAGKWADFDWDAAGEDAGEGAVDAGDEAAGEDAADAGVEAAVTAVAGAVAAAGSDDGGGAAFEGPGEAAVEGDAPGTVRPAAADTADTADAADAAANTAASAPAPKPSGAPRRGRHAAPEPELSPRMKKSKRTRRVLIAVIVLLAFALAGLGSFVYHMFVQSQEEAALQAQEQAAAPKDDITETEADDTVETAVQQADVPVLAGLFGKTADEAVAELGRGAVVTSERKVKEKGSAVKTDVSISLTEEPADSKTGTPSVYLGLDKSGKIVQVGYSASAAALGFGSLSFADAIGNEHVVEKTLAKIGVEVEEGSAALPAKKKDYTTYAADKTTVEMERCSFEGDVTVDGKPCTWSAVLSYDYAPQLVTGNLSDTVRVIYVYLTQK